jgi:hypothetical protein
MIESFQILYNSSSRRCRLLFRRYSFESRLEHYISWLRFFLGFPHSLPANCSMVLLLYHGWFLLILYNSSSKPCRLVFGKYSFESLLARCISWLRCFMVFLIPYGQISVWYLYYTTAGSFRILIIHQVSDVDLYSGGTRSNLDWDVAYPG